MKVASTFVDEPQHARVHLTQTDIHKQLTRSLNVHVGAASRYIHSPGKYSDYGTLMKTVGSLPL